MSTCIYKIELEINTNKIGEILNLLCTEGIVKSFTQECTAGANVVKAQRRSPLNEKECKLVFETLRKYHSKSDEFKLKELKLMGVTVSNDLLNAYDLLSRNIKNGKKPSASQSRIAVKVAKQMQTAGKL